MTFLVHTYDNLVAGRLIKRYKRFFADIELENGEIITAHCPNTGPMTGVCIEGRPVYVSRNNNPKRKLAYTWEMIAVDGTWVGVNTNLPNRVIKNALLNGLFPDLVQNTTVVRSEVVYGRDRRSRIDFLLTHPTEKPIYIEIKNTTYTEGDLALFPDTVTERGQKHLLELMELVTIALPIMLYFINRDDKEIFAPCDSKDPKYGRLFRLAIEKGVKVLPCRFRVTPEGIYYLGRAKLVLD